MLNNKYTYYKYKYLELKQKRKKDFTGSTPPGKELKPSSTSYSNWLPSINLFGSDDDILDKPLSPKAVTVDQIIQIFTNSHLIEKSNQVPKIQPINLQSGFDTPVRKSPRGLIPKAWADDMLVNYQTPMLFSPDTKDAIQSKLDDDNKEIERLETKEDKEDPEYIEYEKNYGKLVEVWFADNARCPCCHAENTLRRYLSDTMPVIDLVCINPYHTQAQGVKFFQVKASDGSLFKSKPYFNFNSKQIHVGSRRMGEPIHMISSSDPNKAYQIGYICVTIDKYNPETDYIKIKSYFTVLPKLEINDGSYYYQYIDSGIESSPTITWNPYTCIELNYQPSPKIQIPKDYITKNYYNVIGN